MSDEYTPTTDEIREYIMVGDPKPWEAPSPEVDARESRRGAAFDRWLAEHDAEVARQQAEHDAQIVEGNLGRNWVVRETPKDVAAAIRAQFETPHA